MLLEQALTVFQRRLGSEHHEVGVTLGNLGAIDARRGDFASAERRLRRALAIKERALGVNHPELVPTLGTLGLVCRRNGNDDDARRLYQRALDVLERHGLSEHPHSVALTANLARLDTRWSRTGERRPRSATAPTHSTSRGTWRLRRHFYAALRRAGLAHMRDADPPPSVASLFAAARVATAGAVHWGAPIPQSASGVYRPFAVARQCAVAASAYALNRARSRSAVERRQLATSDPGPMLVQDAIDQTL
jgi:tetratricopeptide (TPR) repeat protein